MGYLSFDDIMSSTLPEVDVEVSEWGGTVKVRAVTGAEMARCKKDATNRRTDDLDEIKFNALLVVAGSVDPSFPKGSDQRLMREQAAGPVARIAQEIMKLSGFGDDEGDDSGEA